jgi:hypothetical protein
MAFPVKPPRKTIVGPTGRAPIKTVATSPRYQMTPNKTVVGSTAAPPRKTVVGNLAAPRPKVIVGSTAAPPRKTTPANLGVGGKNPLNMLAADRGAINAANPTIRSASLGRNDANPGTSVNPSPKIVGPPNPNMRWLQTLGVSGITSGGQMAANASSGGRARPPRGSRKASQFYGE